MIEHTQEHKASLSEAELSDIARVGKHMGDAIAHDLGSPEEVFGDIRDAAEDVKNVFTKLRGVMDRNEFDEVSEKAERLGKLLEHNEIIGREVKTVSKVVVDLVMDIIAIAGAAAVGNFGAIPAAASNTAIDLAYAGKLMVQGVHSFKGYYKTKLKPKLHKMKIKLEHKEDKLKEELKHIGKVIDKKLDKAEHWIEKKLHVKHKESKHKESKHKESKHKEPIVDKDDDAMVELSHSEELVTNNLDI